MTDSPSPDEFPFRVARQNSKGVFVTADPHCYARTENMARAIAAHHSRPLWKATDGAVKIEGIPAPQRCRIYRGSEIIADYTDGEEVS